MTDSGPGAPASRAERTQPDRTAFDTAGPASVAIRPPATPAATQSAPAVAVSTAPGTPAVGQPAATTPSAPSGPPAAASAAKSPTPFSTCATCWGLKAPSVAQAVTTAVNHLFNTVFDSLAGFPASPLANFVEGALVLIRRSLFGFVPTGVSATQIGAGLDISVNSGSVAYFRNNNGTVEVAGDPGFSDAQQFVASSVSQVLTTGNGGCAGLAVTSGTTVAGLATDGIDALRFGSGAQFAGLVVASGTSALQIGDAVRGMQGVVLSAPVILGRDTEVDAGLGAVYFGGTVDGKGWFGGQSLLVTALGTTTFTGDVGGRTPLGSLTTRGIAPLQIQQSADSKTIPLKYLPLAGGVKYGIDVAIGDNAPRTYLFDTGGNGFFAGYDQAAFSGVTPGDEKVQITYTSGQTLDGLVTSANVTVGSGKQTVSTAKPVDFAAVVSATNAGGQSISPNAPFGTQFAGDFGAAFGVQQIEGKLLYLPGSFITSVLFQLPGNLSSGYLTQLGPIGTTPQMTVGVTDALRAQFTYAIPIDLAPVLLPGFPGTYPNTDYPLLEQFGFNGVYKVAPGDAPDQTTPLGDGPLPSLIDSGAGSTSARLPGLPKPLEADGSLTPGSIFTAKFPTTQGRDQLIWEYTAGTIPSVDQVDYLNITGAATNVANVNTGLNLFNQYDVMYDVAEKVIWLRPNGGQSTVSLQSVTTRGDQSYGQNAQLNGTYTTNGGDFSVGGITQLNGSTVVEARRGDVTFSGTVDAATAGVQGLQVNSRGTTTIVRQVGSVNPLAKLTTDCPGSTSTAGVTTTGAQTYNDDLTVNGTYSTQSGAFTAAKSATVAGGTSVSTTGGSITFAGRVDSTEGDGHVLGVSAANSTVQFKGKIGSKSATSGLGGLNLNGVKGTTTVVTAEDSVKLDGALPNSQGAGLFIGNDVTVNFAHGGTIANFTADGVQFEGASPSSVLRGFTIADNVYDGIQLAGQNYAGAVISDNTIKGNSAFGIGTMQATTGLTIRNNIIGTKGTTNEWGYTSDGPNAQGIVLAPGSYTATTIADNTIQYNRRNGIAAPDGIQGVEISGNTIRENRGNGIEFTGGDFTGTTIKENTITGNGADGISLGAGIGQALNDFGNPLAGYSNSTGAQDPNRFAAGHYMLPWANDPGFYTQPVPSDPQVSLILDGGETLTVNLDTGSRGLYFDQNQIPTLDTSGGTKGFVYLNSSNRLYFGTWVSTDITFPDAVWQEPGEDDTPKVATAKAPVLVVTAIGASTTPPPGSTSPTAVFNTTTDSGTVTITNGTETRNVAVTPGFNGQGSVTIPGGWWATYQDNPILGPVANFGVGFDRSGLGTEPTSNGDNQAYNTFLNLAEMRSGTMRPGYIIANDGVTLGLDNAALQGNSYAYTDLAPSGLSQGDQSAPDWQPATGQFTWTSAVPNQSNTPITSALGPLVIDIGIPTGIMTLPGQSASSTFTGTVNVDLLNSGGKITYIVNPSDTTNQMTATSVAFFDPLAGAYSQNMPPLSQQFFNTGRRLIAGMNYLYDAAGGYEGLWAPEYDDPGDQAAAFKSGNGTFHAAYFPNTTIPGGVTNLTIQDNTISDNGGNGVTVNGMSSRGIEIVKNSIYGNAALGIALTNKGNGNQPTPAITAAAIVSPSTVMVSGSVGGADSYPGPFLIEVFASPASEASNVQGRRPLDTFESQTNDFSEVLVNGVAKPGEFITVTATPSEPGSLPNTSQFSAPVQLA